MSFQIGWHRENRIVKVLVQGEVTLAEAQSLDQSLADYLNKADQSVHVLIDVSQMTGFPASVLQSQNKLHSFSHRQLGWVVFVDEGSALNSRLLHIFSQIFGDKYRAFSNPKLGMDFLKLQDPTLAWLSAAVINLHSRYANERPSENLRRHA